MRKVSAVQEETK